MNMAHVSLDSFTRYSGVELRHLRLVWTVAEEKGLTSAARRLRLTPSALSHQLRTLEEAVGAAVFHRDGKSMRLTAAGEVLLEAAARVLGTVAAAEDRLAKLRTGLTGTVRVSTHCYTGYHWLPAVIAGFRSDFPEAEVTVVGEATRRSLDALYAREIDVAVTTERSDRHDMFTRPVLRDEVLMILPAGHALARKAWLEPADIAREHLLTYTNNPEESALCQEILRPAGVWPRRHTGMFLTEAIVELVRAGLGVSVLAEWAAQPYLSDGRIVAKRITRAGWRRTWNAVTWPKETAGPLVMGFVNHLATEFGTKKTTRVLSA